MKLIAPRISSDVLRRAGWLFLTALFIFTGLGIGIYAFWQSTHNSTDSAQTAAATCQFDGSVSASTYAAPAIYKPETNPTQVVTSDLTVGTGATATSGNCVVTKYYGTLTDGTVFDENYTKPTALQFLLGQGEVIPGWDQGLVGMKVGGERRLIIPAKYGYGSQGSGAIPPNATIVFDVRLLSIK